MTITLPIDLSTPIGKVRTLIPDRGPSWFALQDEEIQVFLDINDNNIRLAAADCLDTIAADRALVQGVTETLDLKVDGAKLLDSLMKRAATLRELGYNEDAFGIVEFGDLTVFNAIEYAVKNGEYAEGFLISEVYD